MLSLLFFVLTVDLSSEEKEIHQDWRDLGYIIKIKQRIYWILNYMIHTTETKTQIDS